MSTATIRAFGTYLDKGTHRPLNEDACLAVPERMIFAVADGYGGSGIGNVAAQSSLEHMRHFIDVGLGDSEVTLPFVYRNYLTNSGNLVFNAFLYANQKLVDENRTRHINARGGASALLTYLAGNKLTIGSVGLCQAYLVRKGRVQPLVRPRSYNAYRGGFQGSWNSKWAFPLTGLGHSTHLEPELFELQIEQGDMIVLATDGIYPSLVDEDFSECYRTLKSANTLDLAISQQNQRLVEIANQKGSVDNQAIITMICA